MSSKPPHKLVWYEGVTDWLSSRPELSTTRSAMNQTAAMVMRATRSQTNEALVAP